MAFFFKNKAEMPDRKSALPGRDTPIRTATTHFVSGAPLKGPYPEGSEIAMFGLGCFWGAEKAFWQLPGVLVTAVGYSGVTRPTPPMRKYAPAGPGTTRWCASSTIRS